jgi:hypothetical protein
MAYSIPVKASFLLRILVIWILLSVWINLNVLFHHDLSTMGKIPLEQTLNTEWKRKSYPVIPIGNINHTSTVSQANQLTIKKGSTSPRNESSRPGVAGVTSLRSNYYTFGNNDPTPAMYWNLSCPLEMSTFSAAHIGGDEFVQRAHKAQNLSYAALRQLKQTAPWLLRRRRIFFVGDSLLRQVFISLSCLYWNQVQHYAVPWFERRHGRMNHANTISHGPHSKFEEARVVLKGGTEFIFHHGIGGLLTLGQDYRSHDPNMWLESCMRGKPFTTNVVDTDYSPIVSELNVPRTTMVLTTEDIVVINGSVHGDRGLNLNNVADLIQCMNRDPHKKKTMWPRLVYVTTGAEHFPTDSGQYEEELIGKNFTCRQQTLFDYRQKEERELVGGLLPILGKDVFDLEREQGDLHVGGRDCLHWIMPGIPDLLAASLITALHPSANTPTSLVK